MIDSNDALVDQFKSRGVEEKARFYVGFMLFDAYYTMNKKEWRNKVNKQYRQAVDRRIGQYYAKHRSAWKKITEEEKMMISNGVRSRSVGEGMMMENITMERWIGQISKVGE